MLDFRRPECESKFMSKPILIYDGDCEFCRRSIAWYQAHDGGHINYLPRQSPERTQRFPQLNDPKHQGSIQLVMPNGDIRSGEFGIATALTLLSGWQWRSLGYFIKAPGILFFAHIIYKWIAKNRHRFRCNDGSCKL